MKIGIYGDSFANSPNQPSMKTHWSTLLQEKLEVETIDNYGIPGSSIFYSYTKFLDNYHKYDLNIFLVTEPNRYIKAVPTDSNGTVFIPSLPGIEVMRNQVGFDRRVANDLRGWFISSCDDYNRVVADLMLEKIKALDKKVIFVPCFYNSLSPDLVAETGVGTNNLHDIQTYQFKLLGLSVDITDQGRESPELISGHFTPEVNEIVCNIMLNRIQTGQWDWTLPDTIGFKHRAAEYYIR